MPVSGDAEAAGGEERGGGKEQQHEKGAGPF